MPLQPGLYEQVINAQIQQELSAIPAERKDIRKVDESDAAAVLAQYLSAIVQKGLDTVRERKGGLQAQIALCNKIIACIRNTSNDSYFDGFDIKAVQDKEAGQLYGILPEKDPLLATGKKASAIERPQTSLARSFLFTGQNRSDPRIYQEIAKEIASANRIDILVSFLKWSGYLLIRTALEEAVQRGCKIRIITTTYTGATDKKTIEALSQLPNTEIKISYDADSTRMHAKAWIFHRNSDFTTAYVGSSNLSKAAMVSGLEWNLKITSQDLPDILGKIEATFESYWNSGNFERYTENDLPRLEAALHKQKFFTQNNATHYTLDVTPYGYQQEILDKLAAERAQGHTRTLVVAATGTGKTVLTALDYRRYRTEHRDRPCRLLFVAHRKEILEQSLATFRAVLKDHNFGELLVGTYRPSGIDALFMSIQSFNSQHFAGKVAPAYYDYIVVDEFHHAAAPSYQELLTYFRPELLVGLTATPERMDGDDILIYFDNRIAAEIRLPEAVDRQLLCPFQYFCVTDPVSLDKIPWARGGYDKNRLSSLYTAGREAEARADMIAGKVLDYVADIEEVKGLGFCVSIDHAAFMANSFNSRSIPSLCLTGQSSPEERDTAKERLVKGEIRFIFVVDLYNEGVDIPEVNTVLFLRPTESLTIFIQQLGRGLRKAQGKDCLTVLDFIGQANKRYRFEEKFAALLTSTENSVSTEIRNGFVSLPMGCSIQMEKLAARYVLENIKSAYSSVKGLAASVADFKDDTGKELTFANFLRHYHIEPRKLYRTSSFSNLCVLAGLRTAYSDVTEKEMLKAMPAFAVQNSRLFLNFVISLLAEPASVSIATLGPKEKRMLRMFCLSVSGDGLKEWTEPEMADLLRKLSSMPTMLCELKQLVSYQLENIDFISENTDLGFGCPLELHCAYTRDQLLAALDVARPGTVREGVKWIAAHKIDVFMVTLNKSDREYSKTTLYKDYSISSTLFHWQSQSTTSDTSETGQRYINHRQRGSRVLLFVREQKTDSLSGKAQAYTFLGEASYVSHQGSHPMSIIWKLDHAIPARFLVKTNKMTQD